MEVYLENFCGLHESGNRYELMTGLARTGKLLPDHIRTVEVRWMKGMGRE